MFRLIISLLMITGTGAAAQNSITGEYYIKNVRETASGFQLNDDSTFRFFYSSGALDRTGSGKWKLEGNRIIFNSNQKHKSDFRLLRSSKKAGDSVTIMIVDKNEILTHYVYAGLKTGKIQPKLQELPKGVIRFPRQAFDAIVLAFEFTPERTSEIAISDRLHNYFEIGFEDWLMEVFFSDFSLVLDGKLLKGGHPMMRSGNYVYEKE